MYVHYGFSYLILIRPKLTAWEYDVFFSYQSERKEKLLRHDKGVYVSCHHNVVFTHEVQVKGEDPDARKRKCHERAAQERLDSWRQQTWKKNN